MRRRLSLTAALVLLLSLLCACAAQHAQEMDENGYELYFLSDPNSAGGGDAIRTQEKRLTLDGAMETEDCVRALMEALLAGPDEPSLSSPIPEGTALKSLKVSGRRAQIDLSAQYARLTGIDLSLADYCITLTLTQLPNVNAVSITADGRELPYRETQVRSRRIRCFSSRESGLRPITVSLLFPRQQDRRAARRAADARALRGPDARERAARSARAGAGGRFARLAPAGGLCGHLLSHRKTACAI